MSTYISVKHKDIDYLPYDISSNNMAFDYLRDNVSLSYEPKAVELSAVMYALEELDYDIANHEKRMAFSAKEYKTHFDFQTDLDYLKELTTARGVIRYIMENHTDLVWYIS